MSRFFRVVVDDETAFADAVYAFVTEQTPARNAMPVVDELHEFAPEMVPVLEHMVIDGVNDRQFVVDYLKAVLGNYSDALLN